MQNEMVTGDTIEVMLEQLGGARRILQPDKSVSIAEAAHEVQKAADVLKKHGSRIAKLVRRAQEETGPVTDCFKEVVRIGEEFKRVDGTIEVEEDGGDFCVSYSVQEYIDIVDEYTVGFVISDGQIQINVTF